MPYSREQIDQIDAMLNEWWDRENTLSHDLFAYEFHDSVAREMMQHGLSRRIADLKHGVERIFEILPPNTDAPTKRDIRDATTFLQAFVINVFGAIDNLAWIWARESDVKDGRGRPVRRSQIGFTPGHSLLRNSVSQRTRSYLEGTDAWFSYLEEYRHALAHRIPLYIPPKMVDENEALEFKRLEAAIMDSGWDWNRWGELQNAQSQFGRFEPVMMHSFGEGAQPIRFHGQIVCDFATLIEIAEHVFRDLQELRSVVAQSV